MARAEGNQSEVQLAKNSTALDLQVRIKGLET